LSRFDDALEFLQGVRVAEFGLVNVGDLECKHRCVRIDEGDGFEARLLNEPRFCLPLVLRALKLVAFCVVLRIGSDVFKWEIEMQT
jgi:hypothetical protein